MPKKISLEDKFIKAVGAASLEFESKIISVHGKLYLPNFVFGNLIVEVEAALPPTQMDLVKQFVKAPGAYKVFLLTENTAHAVEVAEYFDEVFDYKSIHTLIAEIKKHKA